MSRSLAFIFGLFVLINAGTVSLSIRRWAMALPKWKYQTPSYSYIGPDFPPVHPSLTLRPASLTLQESVRYGANGSDPVASQEWETLKAYPHGLGRAFFGPERREFLMTFYHQLHCVRQIERGLVDLDDPEATPHHMKHCLDYLRQTILCSATSTLEKGDFLERDWELQRIGDDVVCWDWEIMYKELGDGWDDFVTWRNGQRETRHV